MDKAHRNTTQLPRWALAVGLIVALLVGGLAGSYVTARTGWPFASGQTVPLFVTGGTNQIAEQLSFAAGFTPVARAVQPAVVTIASSRIVRAPETGSLPFFHDFFGGPFGSPRQRREQGLGSGVIVSPDGHILTNNHVIEGASEIQVSLADGREFNARIVGTDPQTDIGVLKIDEGNLPTLVLGDSSQVQVGEFVLAVGNPFGVGQTVTMGVIGATGRSGLNIEQYEDFLQTDAAINPGNSGGALVNARGELIGINTAIIARGAGGSQGVGFAVPINMARYVMEQILKQGRVIRGWLGVSIQPVTAAIAKTFGLSEARGALVADVVPNSPAAQAGINKGDVITAINGETVADSRALRLKVAQMAPGTTARLKLFRDGGEREVSVTLGELPSEARRAGGGGERSGAAHGLAVDELTPQVARQLGLPPDARGVVIVEVRPGSPAAAAGLQRGDVIQQVNRQPAASVAEFNAAIGQAGGEPVLLLINRGGNTFFVVVELRQ